MSGKYYLRLVSEALIFKNKNDGYLRLVSGNLVSGNLVSGNLVSGNLVSGNLVSGIIW